MSPEIGINSLENDKDVKDFIHKHTLTEIHHIVRVSKETASPEMKGFLEKCIKLYPKVPIPGEGRENKVNGEVPCVICNNSSFIRTGVCLTCLTCGSSSSCS